ncbi:MAG: MFS transporter [Rhodobacterales bacterium]|nr:MAG: MFS transporter [Rhodobacterales bacterium]
MLQVLKSSWALLLGMLFLMIGNGLQGTLLGVRGGMEQFSTLTMSVVMSAYFVGFLGGSHLTPALIRRVGHVRVFAALASFISAVLILYPALPYSVTWVLGRMVIGFCFSGVYVTAESWLNNSASNENRGQALSLYMLVQMAGVVTAQGLLMLGDPAGYELFVVSSVLVSISFAPILLSISPTPAFEAAKSMSLKELYHASPLSFVGMFLMGGVFSAQFAMSAVYGTVAGLSLAEISIFVASIYVGALVFQYPIGWLSDRVDRRVLIMAIALFGCVSALLGYVFEHNFMLLLMASFLLGGMANPLYPLLIAYANDYLEVEDMPAASGGFNFINGLGAIAGPLSIGWIMGQIGPGGFFLFLASLMLLLALYAAYRMTQRAAIPVEETVSYSPITPTASPVIMEVAQEVFIESAQEEGSHAAVKD